MSAFCRPGLSRPRGHLLQFEFGCGLVSAGFVEQLLGDSVDRKNRGRAGFGGAADFLRSGPGAEVSDEPPPLNRKPPGV